MYANSLRHVQGYFSVVCAIILCYGEQSSLSEFEKVLSRASAASQLVENLPGMHNALGSIPNTRYTGHGGTHV